MKRSLCFFAALICCIALTVGVSAEAVNRITLKASGSEAAVAVDFPQAAAEEIASMQLSLKVDSNSDKAEIEFIPDEGLSANITESRYHKDTGILNIYLAGSEPLFSGSAPLAVGTVRISGGSVSAAVSVVEGSVKFVRGGEVIENEELTGSYGEIAYPSPVTIRTGSGSSGGSVGRHTHKYGDWTVTANATCLTEGERTRTCRTCGREDIEVIPKLEHNYVKQSSHEADGTTAGYTDYICAYCADTKREFDIISGDVDKNGKVNALDAALILKAAVNDTELDTACADFNKDGAVNALDAAAILKWVVSQ